MEGNKVSIIFVNPGCGSNGTPQTAPNVFYGGFGVTFIWLCIDIETVFVFPVTAGLYLFTKKNRFWIPFQISAKGVKNHDETGSEVHGLILLKEHA